MRQRVARPAFAVIWLGTQTKRISIQMQRKLSQDKREKGGRSSMGHSGKQGAEEGSYNCRIAP